MDFGGHASTAGRQTSRLASRRSRLASRRNGPVEPVGLRLQRQFQVPCSKSRHRPTARSLGCARDDNRRRQPCLPFDCQSQIRNPESEITLALPFASKLVQPFLASPGFFERWTLNVGCWTFVVAFRFPRYYSPLPLKPQASSLRPAYQHTKQTACHRRGKIPAEKGGFPASTTPADKNRPKSSQNRPIPAKNCKKVPI